MIRKKFIGRRNELNSLMRTSESEGFEFMVITGRRRVGKSRLLREFSKDKTPLFLMCEDRKWEYNLDKFNSLIGSHFSIPKPGFRSFRDCFEYIKSKDPNSLIIIDEFSYLNNNKEIFAEFQGIIDEVLMETKCGLIISGSSISMMEREVLGKKSPLYGRTTSNLVIRPFNFSTLFEWFPDISMEDAVRLFGVCDGIPKYLEFFEGKDVLAEIERNLFQPDTFLFREPRYLLEEELREPATYYQILEGISLGRNNVTEIAQYSYIEPKNISVYLETLMNLGFVKREKPIMGKKSIYRISDNLFRFWFRFTSPHFSEIDAWYDQGAKDDLKSNFDHYLGPVFEEVCRQIARSWMKYPTLGGWWFNEEEIDIVGLNQSAGEVLFAECKWSSGKMDRSLFFDLLNKSRKFRWRNDDRKEQFALFSRGGFTERLKEISRERSDLILFDLEEMEKTVMNKIQTTNPD